MKGKILTGIFLLVFICVGISFAGNNLPPIAKVGLVTEKNIKVTYKDPYRWMENSDDPLLYEWLSAQKEYTDAQTASPLRDELTKEFTDILSKQNARAEEAEKDMSDIFEENIFRRHRFYKDNIFGKYAGLKKASPSGKYELVYSPGNTDIKTLQIYDTSIGGYLKDVLNVKFCDCFWDADEKSFVYLSGRDGRMSGTTYTIRRHSLGKDQLSDTLLYESKDALEDLWIMFEYLGKLWVCRNKSSEYNIIFTLDSATGEQETILQTNDGLSYIGYYDGKLIFCSFIEESMGEILSYDLQTGSFSKTVGARDVPFDRATVVEDGTIYATYVRNGANELFRHDIGSGVSQVIDLPEQGNVYAWGIFSGELLFSIHTCVTGPAIYGYDPLSGNIRLVQPGEKPDVELDA